MPEIYLEWTKLGVDLLKIVAWPVLILLLAWAFRQPLTRLIDRIQKIGREGLQAGPVEQQSVDARQSAEQELAKAPVDPDPLVQAWAKPLKAQLDEAVKKLGGDPQTIVLAGMARATLREHFERTYNIIWGSQISALQTVNTAGPINVEGLRPVYQQAVANDPLRYQNYRFEQWLSFMVGSLLLKRDGDTISITLEGQAFLKYLVDRQYSTIKPG